MSEECLETSHRLKKLSESIDQLEGQTNLHYEEFISMGRDILIQNKKIRNFSGLMTKYNELINESTERNYQMNKTLYDEVTKMNEEVTEQGSQIEKHKDQIQTLENKLAVLQPKIQKEEGTQTNGNSEDITVPIITKEFKKLNINPETKRRIKPNFKNLNETAGILSKVQDQQNLSKKLTEVLEKY